MKFDNKFARLPLVLAGASAILGITSEHLSAQVEMLPEVVVTASRIPVPSPAVGSAMTVIDGNDIDAKQDRFVGEVLREVPGIAVSRTGNVGAQTQVRIRGAEANHTLVLIDGIEVADPAAGSEFDFGNLLANEIERIEVLRGPQSALWGSDAIGGVVNVVTRRGRGKPQISVGTEAGSFRTARGVAGFRTGSDRYHFAAHAAGVHTDGVSMASEWRGNDEQDGHRNRTVHVKAGLSPSSNARLDFVGRWTDTELETDSFISGTGLTDTESRTSSVKRYYRGSAALSALDGLWTHEVSAGLTNSHRKNFQNGAFDSVFEGEKRKFDYQTSLRFGTPGAAGAEHSVTLAAEREEENVVSRSAFLDVDRDVANVGYVAEYRLDLLDSIYVSLAGRHDDADLFDDARTYRITGAYEHAPWGTRFHASYGEGVKNPTIFELFGFASGFRGNPNLSPETATGWDAGLEQSLLGGEAILDVTYFETDVTDLIRGFGDTAVNLPGTSGTYGVELAGTWQLGDGLTLSGTYTWSVGQDATDTELVRRPKHIGSLNANYAFESGDRPGWVNVGIDFNGERADDNFDSFPPTRVRLKSFTLLKIVAGYQVGPGIEIYVRGENLLDREYEEVVTYGTPGSAVYAGVRAEF